MRRVLIALAALLLAQPAHAATDDYPPFIYWPIPSYATSVASNGLSGVAMPNVNDCVAHCFIAKDTDDVLGGRVNFSAITTAGTIELRTETADTTTGKPSGSLYDANATKSFTPAAGWNNVVFDTPPTTGLTAGDRYCNLWLTTGAGTTMTMRAHALFAGAASSTYGSAYAVFNTTADNCDTRSNVAAVAGHPNSTIQFEGTDAEESLEYGFVATAAGANQAITGTVAEGAQFILDRAEQVVGVRWMVNIAGTPTDDPRARIFDSGGTAVAGADRTVDLNYLTNGRAQDFIFGDTPISLAAGTYYIMIDANNANSANCHRVQNVTMQDASLVPDNWIRARTTDITAVPPTFSTTETDIPELSLILVDQAACASSGACAWGF